MDRHDIAPLAFFDGPDGHRVAYRYLSGSRPALVFLPGYKSDMKGTKAQAVLAHAAAHGRACLLLDYSGCGHSEGTFAEGTLSRWRDEVVALIRALGLPRVVLCGSSMGGWLMLMVAHALPERVAALVGIAAAPDFTAWGYSREQQTELGDGHVIYEENPYGIELTPTHPGFWADGQENRLLGTEIDFDGPVRLIHSQSDTDVPWEIALKLAAALRSDDVQVTLVKDGDHRLSRDADIALLLRVIDALPRDHG